ncbi:Por secretion system C-terminal sorting domain-containing protein [Paenimyroides ummariense]|uniref:Por secretion system C-terminal sorting domain-containing protein n=1 Tax=Paenimyroides ummariense TaxID=913024 RepID=A0A1I5BXQ6_9FLAO|nr:T9SS type A sorting domain-containing protein [Paenimyroides ummariense]SFN79536.1 Por secretion system C-terminal sorting domain-containing protein [Paenimyroides ummariense]
MKNKFLIWFWILFPLLAFSQGENDNWYFGNKAAVNFSGTTPLVLNNSVMNTLEAVGSISDLNGNLLFYTDGLTIWDREHNIMVNGTGLTGDSSSQQLIIVKDPGNLNRYYVFTTALSFPPTSYIAYSIVDMSLGPISLNDGLPLGEVDNLYKNFPIFDSSNNFIQTEAITAIPHSDGSSYWILIPFESELYSYLLNSNGLSNVPVVSSLGNVTLQYYYYGIKPSLRLNNSLNYSHFITINQWVSPGFSNTYSFDNNTGKITNDYLLEISTIGPYLSEFNKDASILYLSSRYNAEVFAIDIPNSIGSVVSRLIYSNSSITNDACGIQRNTQGDIYVSIEDRDYLAKIVNHNSFLNSYVDENNIYLNGNSTRMGLPQRTPLHDGCISDILLNSPETNNNFLYKVSNTITTQSNYLINGQNISMKAGNSITFLPNTEIVNGSDFLATIETCYSSKPNISNWPEKPLHLKTTIGTVKTSLVLDDKEIYVFPNPTTDILNISSKNGLEMKEIKITDLSGRIVRTLNNASTINVSDLSAGTYLIDITTNEGKASSKFIKK